METVPPTDPPPHGEGKAGAEIYVSAQGHKWLRITRAGSKAREGGKLEVT